MLWPRTGEQLLNIDGALVYVCLSPLGQKSQVISATEAGLKYRSPPSIITRIHSEVSRQGINKKQPASIKEHGRRRWQTISAEDA